MFYAAVGSQALSGFVLGLFSEAMHDLKDLMALIWLCFWVCFLAKSVISPHLMALFAPLLPSRLQSPNRPLGLQLEQEPGLFGNLPFEGCFFGRHLLLRGGRSVETP